MRLEEPFVYRIDQRSRPHPVFEFIAEHGPVERREAYATFNMGVGFALYVAPAEVGKCLKIAAGAGYDAWRPAQFPETGNARQLRLPRWASHTMLRRCRCDEFYCCWLAINSSAIFGTIRLQCDGVIRSSRQMPTEFFQVKSEASINVVELMLPVSIDTQEFDRLNVAMSSLFVDPGGDRWVLDLSHLSYMGSSALGLMVNLQQIKTAGGRLVLCGLSPKLLEIFHTCCLERLFTIVKTQEDARRELKHAR